MFQKFLIEIEDCDFSSSVEETQREPIAPGVAMKYAFDPPDRNLKQIIYLIVSKKIEGKMYRFISQPMNTDVENTRIRIAFFNASYIHYDPLNPDNYFFEL